MNQIQKNISCRRKRIHFYLAVGVFILCFIQGLRMAEDQSVWGDERYSAVYLQRLNYGEIFVGGMKEGNKAPLFYILQKAYLNLTKTTLPDELANNEALFNPFRIDLRVVPIFAISLSVALLFFFFAFRYTWWAGCLAIVLALTSHMIHVHWIESRPYAIWLFLSTAQSLVFLQLRETKAKNLWWVVLVIIHILLSFTTSISILQIVLLTLYLVVLEKRAWHDYLLMSVVPLIICFYYYKIAPEYQFWFWHSPVELFSACFPKERVVILILFGIFLLLDYLRKRTDGRLSLTNIRQLDRLPSSAIYADFSVGLIVMAWILMGFFWIKAAPEGQGFSISNRYWIFLTPASIIASTLAFCHISFSDNKLRWMFLALMLLLVFLRVLHTPHIF